MVAEGYAPTKVGEFGFLLGAKQDVAGLDVTVQNLHCIAVKVGQSCRHLAQEQSRWTQAKNPSRLPLHELFQISMASKLQEEEKALLGLNRLQCPGDVWMTQALLQQQFPSDLLEQTPGSQRCLRNHLQGHVLPRRPLPHEANHCIGATAQKLRSRRARESGHAKMQVIEGNRE